jgi:hypothetical protein
VSSESAAEMIAAVQASPAAVAAHDRGAWVGLFARNGEVNDPVGSRPHVGRAAIERFYDTFIAPNTIVFRVEHDIVCGKTVVRDLALETIMSTGARLSVPMHLRYELVREDGALKIHRLCAHWELQPMIAQMMRQGANGIWTSTLLGLQMMRHLGIGGSLGFAEGFRGVGDDGKRRVEALLEAMARDDAASAQQALGSGARLEWPAGTPLPLRALLGKTRGLQWRKLLAAGPFVTASVSLDGGVRHGVALFEFNKADRRIGRMQFFVSE